MYACVNVYASYVCVCGGQKVSDPLELEMGGLWVTKYGCWELGFSIGPVHAPNL